MNPRRYDGILIHDGMKVRVLMEIANTLALINHRYRLCVRQDDYSSLRGGQSLPSSVANFLAFLISTKHLNLPIDEVPPPFRELFRLSHESAAQALPLIDDLSMPLGKLLDIELRTFEESPTIGDLFGEFFAGSFVNELINDVRNTYPSDPPKIHSRILAELDISSMHEFDDAFGRIFDEDIGNQIVDGLFAIFRAENDEKPLQEFYRAKRNGAFYGRPENARLHRGRLLKSLVSEVTPAALSLDGIATADNLKIKVDLYVYEELDPPCPVSALHWQATLVDPSQPNAPLSKGEGFLYICEREDGECIAVPEDLARASHRFEGVGLQQVATFLDDHKDAIEIMKASDLCFCSEWERADGAPRGSGALLLSRTVGLIAAKFRRVKALVMDSRPMQYRQWESALRIPKLATELQASIESLTQYTESVKPANIEVRYIFNRLAGIPAIAHAMDKHAQNIERQLSALGTDYRAIAPAIASLFDLAGMDELAELVTLGQASDVEVRNVLTVLLLHRRIAYIPLSTGSFELSDGDVDSLQRDELEPIDDYEDEDEVLTFVDRIPHDCRIDGVYVDDDGGYIIGVTYSLWIESKVVYEVFEYFTLHKVPPPVDLSQILQGL